MKSKKKTYEKPKIVYRKKIETIAAVCDSARAPQGGCRTPALACESLYS